MPSEGDTPTERYFPATLQNRKAEAEDKIARILAGAAILLVGASYLWSYKQNVDEVTRERTICAREQRDLRVELRAWEEVSAYGPSVDDQIRRLESVLRRDCNRQHPGPSLF